MSEWSLSLQALHAIAALIIARAMFAVARRERDVDARNARVFALGAWLFVVVALGNVLLLLLQ